MTSTFPQYLDTALTRSISKYTGLHFPPSKRRALHRGISAAAEEMGFDSSNDLAIFLTSKTPSAALLNVLVKHLTIGETFFFRDKHLFQILKDDIFRGLRQQPRRGDKSIRIWSAGCATGEEPYSIAILIDQMAYWFRDWQITIIGTDVNPDFLEKARTGTYSRWSFRDTPDAIVDQYFTAVDAHTFELIPRIRDMVRFESLNFVSNDYLSLLHRTGPVDLILCRNVMMYFDLAVREAVLRKLNQLLIEDGWLVVGPAETGFIKISGLTPVRFPNAILHRKGPPRRTEKSGELSLMAPAGPVRPQSGSFHRPESGTKNRRKTDGAAVERAPTNQFYQDALTTYEKGRYRATMRILTPVLNDRSARSTQFLMLTESMALMARCHANLGELQEAEYWCQSAIAREKLNPAHHYLLATIYQEANRIAEAVRAVKQSLYLDPELIMGHFTLGVLMQQAHRKPEAVKHFQNALALLAPMGNEEPVPLSEGMRAGRLKQTVELMV
ncbi:MAG: CheR family methyltransferase [Thermodesulfobacteriota bacterium]